MTAKRTVRKFEPFRNVTMDDPVLKFPVSAALAAALSPFAAEAASITLFDQDFEAPAIYNNDGGDVNIFNDINDNYGGQPAGFTFAQAFTVETLNVSGSDRGTGTAAFGTGWSDPSGIGGDFAIGMLSNVQNDRLGLSFDVGDFPFFNVGVDISSIDLSTFSGPFVPPGVAPIFRFSLFDNPGGGPSIGGGTLLSTTEITGTASPQTVFDWTAGSFGLST
ncbi:MAG: hypothetical protein AAF390_21165, partial [Pseudomonadota bacterium]